MADENKPKVWPPTSAESVAPYKPASFVETDNTVEKPTGVEDVRYNDVTNVGAPVNPATPQEAMRRALSHASSLHSEPEDYRASDPAGYKASNYAELIEQLQRRMIEIKPLTKEEIEKQKRQQRTKGIIAGIADAVGAISNLFFTTQYAPNMHNPKESMSVKARERFDKAKAQRDADDNLYLNYAMQLGRAREAVDAQRNKEKQQNIALQLKINEDARRQAKAEYDAKLAEIDLDIKLEGLGAAEAKKRLLEAKADYERALADHADEKILSEINKNNRANRGGSRGGSGRPGEHIVKFPDGHTETFHSESAARNNAATKGGTYITTPITTTNSSTNTDRRGRTSTRETTSTRNVSTPKVEVDWD